MFTPALLDAVLILALFALIWNIFASVLGLIAFRRKMGQLGNDESVEFRRRLDLAEAEISDFETCFDEIDDKIEKVNDAIVDVCQELLKKNEALADG